MPDTDCENVEPFNWLEFLFPTRYAVRRMENQMATLIESVEALKVAVLSATARISEDFETLKTQLADAIAANPDAQAAADSITAAVADLNAIDPIPDVVVPDPEPEPVPEPEQVPDPAPVPEPVPEPDPEPPRPEDTPPVEEVPVEEPPVEGEPAPSPGPVAETDEGAL